MRSLALQASLPFRIVGTRTRYTDLADRPYEPDYANIHHRNGEVLGLGDAQVLLHGARRFAGFEGGVRLGLSLPTGRVHDDPYDLGHRGLEHQHIQLGTGTWDPIVGFDLARPFGPVTAALFGQVQVPLYQGPKGYRAGGRYFGGAVAAMAVGDTGLTARIGMNVLHESAERWGGVVPHDDGNQGRTDLYVSPGVTWAFGGDWSASLDVRVRAYGHVVGAQLDLPVLIELSIGRLLHLESGEHVEADDHHDEGEEEGPRADVLDLVTGGELAPIEPVAGKWTVIDFWAPWCEACLVLDRGLRDLARRNPGVAIRRVNIVDFDSPIAQRELPGVDVLPRVRVLEPSGRVAFEKSGPSDELLEAVEKLTAR